LRLDDAEVETMAGELSGILEHVDRIAELDLDDVPPTSHVVELENVLRKDEPHESLDRDVALAQAPDPAGGAFRVPSPQAEA
jgi:aspartyl-tRNA(Asn)/glutamyl-tRNA(Gln) amidotransferase subunit C